MITCATVPDLERVVEDVVFLQGELLLALLSEHGEQLTDENPQRWPQKGKVSIAGSVWTFRRHGVGYAFDELGGPRRIDVPEYIQAPPYPVDAHRLQEYLEALGVAKCGLAGEEYDSSDALSLHEGLEKLRVLGRLSIDARTIGRQLPSYFLRGRSEAE